MISDNVVSIDVTITSPPRTRSHVIIIWNNFFYFLCRMSPQTIRVTNYETESKVILKLCRENCRYGYASRV